MTPINYFQNQSNYIDFDNGFYIDFDNRLFI